MRVSFVSKLTSAWLAGVALLAVVLASAVRHTYATREARAWVTHTYVVLDSVGETAAALGRVEGAERGYLLTGDRA